MKAIVTNQFGGVENLVTTDLPTPVLKDNEVLVKVKAISINPVDVKTRQGKGMAGRLTGISPLIIGWDISGVVTDTGSAVTKFKKGDEVFGMVNFPAHGQAYAEFVASPESHLALKPSGISHEEAAAATLAALTAWQVLKDNADIQPGRRVLVHAASGGVGHYAVQIARYFGAYVIGTSSAANRDFVLNLGASEHVDYKSQTLEAAVADIDFVLDSLGADNVLRSLPVVKPGGRIVSILGGMNAEVAEKATALGIDGTSILVKSDGEDMEELAELMRRGILKSHIDKVFSFDQMREAHLQVETGRTIGKVIVTL
jgi:NADPH:quinone reductase-like Zn-dependent oxidoreductase